MNLNTALFLEVETKIEAVNLNIYLLLLCLFVSNSLFLVPQNQNHLRFLIDSYVLTARVIARRLKSELWSPKLQGMFNRTRPLKEGGASMERHGFLFCLRRTARISSTCMVCTVSTLHC